MNEVKTLALGLAALAVGAAPFVIAAALFGPFGPLMVCAAVGACLLAYGVGKIIRGELGL